MFSFSSEKIVWEFWFVWKRRKKAGELACNPAHSLASWSMHTAFLRMVAQILFKKNCRHCVLMRLIKIYMLLLAYRGKGTKPYFIFVIQWCKNSQRELISVLVQYNFRKQLLIRKFKGHCQDGDRGAGDRGGSSNTTQIFSHFCKDLSLNGV